MREILYPYALDHSGNVAGADVADRNESFTCIGCGERMVLRRGKIKVAHFGHWPGVESCGGETVLHKMAKAAIKYGIERAIREKTPYSFTWYCSVCLKDHKGDLAVNEREIRVEEQLNGIRPDLLAVSMKGKPLVAIEVIVSHYPEPETVEVYERIGIPVVLVRVGWDELKELSKGLGRVEVLNTACRAKRCSKCNEIMLEVEVGSLDGYPCWKCRKRMPVLWFDGRYGGAARDLSKRKIEVAAELGIRLEWVYSRTAGYKYQMHVCPSCGAKQGNYYIYDDHENPDRIDRGKPDHTVEYYWCGDCDLWEAKGRAAKGLAAGKIINPQAKGGLTDGDYSKLI